MEFPFAAAGGVKDRDDGFYEGATGVGAGELHYRHDRVCVEAENFAGPLFDGEAVGRGRAARVVGRFVFVGVRDEGGHGRSSGASCGRQENWGRRKKRRPRLSRAPGR